MWVWIFLGVIVVYIVVTVNNDSKRKIERAFQHRINKLSYDLNRYVKMFHYLSTFKVRNLEKFSYLVDEKQYERYLFQLECEILSRSELMLKLMDDKWKLPSRMWSRDDQELLKHTQNTLFGESAYRNQIDEEDFVLLMLLGREQEAAEAFAEEPSF